jgi:hypothetical protein
MSPAGYDVLDGVHVRATLANLDLETSVAVEALLERGVVTRKLELMKPFELQCDEIECLRRWRRRQSQYRNQEVAAKEIFGRYPNMVIGERLDLSKAGNRRTELFDDRGPLRRNHLRRIERQPEPRSSILDRRDSFEDGTRHSIGLDRAFEAFDLNGFLGDT